MGPENRAARLPRPGHRTSQKDRPVSIHGRFQRTILACPGCSSMRAVSRQRRKRHRGTACPRRRLVGNRPGYRGRQDGSEFPAASQYWSTRSNPVIRHPKAAAMSGRRLRSRCPHPAPCAGSSPAGPPAPVSLRARRHEIRLSGRYPRA